MRFFVLLVTCFLYLPGVTQPTKNIYIDKDFIAYFLKSECSNSNITYFQKEAFALEIEPDSAFYDYLGLSLSDSATIQDYVTASISFQFDTSLINNFKLVTEQYIHRVQDSLQKIDIDSFIPYLSLSLPFSIKNKNLIWLYSNFNLGPERGCGMIYIYNKEDNSFKLVTKKVTWIN